MMIAAKVNSKVDCISELVRDFNGPLDAGKKCVFLVTPAQYAPDKTTVIGEQYDVMRFMGFCAEHSVAPVEFVSTV